MTIRRQHCSIDCFLGKQRSKDYNCADFVAEVWLHLYGEDIGELAGKHISVVGVKTLLKQFVPMRLPLSPCLVVMQRPKVVPHVGIYLDGRILHLVNAVEFQPVKIATRGFDTVRYYGWYIANEQSYDLRKSA